MDTARPLRNPYIVNVLKTFESAAGQSLKGPQTLDLQHGHMSTSELAEYVRAIKSYAPTKLGVSAMPVDKGRSESMQPIFLVMDTLTGDRAVSKIENQVMDGFDIGGEKRLCLPQIINTVLDSFTMEQIHTVCAELHIYFSRCNPRQLNILKKEGILPHSAASCGLITKTDAERLCHKLLHNQPIQCRQDPVTANSFKVYHECFGKCKGIFSPELYISPESLCIECYECCGMFSPSTFVCHSHKDCENKICHWGFDSENWRSYLLLAKDQDQENLLKCLAEMKEKFDPKQKFKRKQKVADGVAKKSKGISQASPLIKPHPKFQVFVLPTTLEKGPPKLLNPERVVPFEEHERYGRDFVPNVSLAPLPADKRPAEVTIDDSYDFELSSSSETEFSAPNSPNAQASDEPMDCISNYEDDELRLLHKAFKVTEETSQKERDSIVEAFLELRESSKMQIQNLVKANADCNKQLNHLKTSKKQKLEELMEAQREQRKEIQRLKVEKQIWTKELASEKNRLLQEIDNMRSSHSREISKIRSSHRKETEHLRQRTSQFEQMFAQMSQEILYLRAEMKKQGKNIPDIQYNLMPVKKERTTDVDVVVCSSMDDTDGDSST